MPFFDLKTNVKDVPAEFHKETTDLIANLLGKPNSVVGVNVDAGARYTFGGTEDPAGVVNIYSAGSLAADKNNSSAKVISEHLQKHFNIPSGRLLIFFHDMPRTHVGFNGKTLAN